MTEPVKMWAVVRDDGSMFSYPRHSEDDARAVAERWSAAMPESAYTVKPCEVRIIEDER